MVLLHFITTTNAIDIAHNDVFDEHTKHIKVDCYFIHDHIRKDTLHLLNIGLLYKIANVFTKFFQSVQFYQLLFKLNPTIISSLREFVNIIIINLLM